MTFANPVTYLHVINHYFLLLLVRIKMKIDQRQVNLITFILSLLLILHLRFACVAILQNGIHAGRII